MLLLLVSELYTTHSGMCSLNCVEDNIAEDDPLWSRLIQFHLEKQYCKKSTLSMLAFCKYQVMSKPHSRMQKEKKMASKISLNEIDHFPPCNILGIEKEINSFISEATKNYL